MHRRHFQNLARCYLGRFALEFAHLGKKAEAGVARQAVGPEANVEAERAQFFQIEGRMTQECVAARTVREVELRGAREKIEIAVSEFVQVRDDPSLVDFLSANQE